MSKVAQVSPQGSSATPARPPSPPSRAPLFIWSGVALFCLLMFGSALGLFLWSREAFSSKDLKTATSLKINYLLAGMKPAATKTVVVNDPAEVRTLLDALEITDSRMGPQWGISNQGSVDFTLADGTIAHATFVNRTQLDRANWGQVYVTDAFYRKVNEAATRAEGRPIDVMKVNN
ncbi:MAG TPA: hypothetical protein VKA46_06345 [Gemmataceae bacterium]|nr:hypothetical protein [Gemmataceae bacterium]